MFRCLPSLVVAPTIALHAVALPMNASEPKTRPPLPTAEEIARLPQDGGPEFNRLIFQKSPYLLQHARNPVDWWPWGEAAFAEAKKQGKPVFLSIGYTTFITAVAVVGLQICTGYAGQINLGQSAFMGVGAYGAALAMAAGWDALAGLLIGGMGAALTRSRKSKRW
jgi:hypothetical protein